MPNIITYVHLVWFQVYTPGLTGKQECYIMRQWQLFYQRKSNASHTVSYCWHFLNLFSDYSVLSNFTWKLLDDSGWYRVNFTFTNTAVEQFDLQWGRGLLYVVEWTVFLTVASITKARISAWHISVALNSYIVLEGQYSGGIIIQEI